MSMFAFIFTIVFGIIIAFFATQNTTPVSLQLGSYTASGIPMYLVILISLLMGLLFAWIFSLLTALSSLFTLRGKDQLINHEKKTNEELKRRVHDLELENARLATKSDHHIHTTAPVQ